MCTIYRGWQFEASHILIIWTQVSRRANSGVIAGWLVESLRSTGPYDLSTVVHYYSGCACFAIYINTYLRLDACLLFTEVEPGCQNSLQVMTVEELQSTRVALVHVVLFLDSGDSKQVSTHANPQAPFPTFVPPNTRCVSTCSQRHRVGWVSAR